MMSYAPACGDFCFLSCDHCSSLCSFHCTCYLLTHLARPHRDKSLAPGPRHQQVVSILALFYLVARQCGSPIAVSMVAKPVTLVLEAVRALGHAEACASVGPPLAQVNLYYEYGESNRERVRD